MQARERGRRGSFFGIFFNFSLINLKKQILTAHFVLNQSKKQENKPKSPIIEIG